MEKQIYVKEIYKNYYLFQRDYKIMKWIFNHKGYEKENKILDNISFTVNKGEVLGIIGANGAGKSTLMKIIAGITYPSSGTVETIGRIGSLINLSAGFHPDYTGRKNIYYKGTLLGMSRTEIDEIIEDIYEFTELGDYFERPLRMYSSGMAARLGFALAALSKPEILIVDEVFAVGDKAFQKKSKEKIIELFRGGNCVLFSSHSDSLIQEFCSRVIYLSNGKIVYDGEVREGLRIYAEEVSKHEKK